VRAPFPTDQNAPANLGAALYLRSTHSICEVKKPLATEKQRKRCLYDTAGGSFENLIFKRYACDRSALERYAEKFVLSPDQSALAHGSEAVKG
jgi:hypothetical protein